MHIAHPQITPLALRIDEACRFIGLGRTRLYSLIKEGKIRPVKIGGRTLIPVAELKRLVAAAMAA